MKYDLANATATESEEDISLSPYRTSIGPDIIYWIPGVVRMYWRYKCHLVANNTTYHNLS
jgi:hypothetical protein